MSLWKLVLLIALFNLMTFGNGPVMIPLLQTTLVDGGGVLTQDQLLYAFTVARVTPGQANLYVAPIGYMLYGMPGAILTTLTIILPGYVMIPGSGRVRLGIEKEKAKCGKCRLPCPDTRPAILRLLYAALIAEGLRATSSITAPIAPAPRRAAPALAMRGCGRCLSQRRGTAFFNLKTAEAEVRRSLDAMLRGDTQTSTSQTRRHRRDTLRRWRRRAAPHARAVDEEFVTDLRVRDLELDEQWSFAGSKKAPFADNSERGEAWWHKAMARESRLLVEQFVSPRTTEAADMLVNRSFDRLAVGCLPRVSRDGDAYTQPLSEQVRVVTLYPLWWALTKKGKLWRRPPLPQVPDPALVYGQVVKEREGRRVVKVEKRLAGAARDRPRLRLDLIAGAAATGRRERHTWRPLLTTYLTLRGGAGDAGRHGSAPRSGEVAGRLRAIERGET